MSFFRIRFVFLVVCCLGAAGLIAAPGRGGIAFTENKGQVGDQYLNPRPDVVFSGFTGGFLFHLKSAGISYQFSRAADPAHTRGGEIPAGEHYRLDVNWPGANVNAEVAGNDPLEGHSNFYLSHCPGGALGVKSYREVVYRNLYAGIDLKWYQKNGSLKYDYEVKAGADYHQIKLEIKGAENISINAAGCLVLETPLGTIMEEAPLVLQAGKKLASKWVLQQGAASFEISGIDPGKPFVIDPIVREWGTYYGAGGNEYCTSLSSDASGNIYMAGGTASTGTLLATSGAHQVTYAGSWDAFLVAMNASGARLWATYYGGSSTTEDPTSCAPDASGNVYLFGSAPNSTVIATAGAHQPIFGGNNDAFLVKFNSSGVRQWATWYGGSGGESSGDCTVDASGNVFISGQTSTSSTGTAIVSPNGFQITGPAFIAKFTGSGTRLWGTRFGDDGIVRPIGLATNASGDVYIAGATTCTGTGMTTVGAHQLLNGGLNDAFLSKFNAGGILVWSTYYGGAGQDQASGCAVDAGGNVYISGSTSSTVSIIMTSPVAHQPSFGGNSDGFLAKFDPSGVRLWSTYYGGTQYEAAERCVVEPGGDIYICGTTDSPAGIASPGAYQPGLAGSTDAYLARFNSNGIRLWATYYGDNNNDEAISCTTHTAGAIYVCGTTVGGSNAGVLTSQAAFQPTLAGGSDCLVFKLIDCMTLPPSPANMTPSANIIFCPGGSATLSASGTGTLSWYAVPSGSFAISGGSTFTTPALFSNTTYYLEDKVCGSSVSRTAITVTVLPLPAISVAGPAGVCPGVAATMTAGGASSYTWMPGNFTGPALTLTPAATDQYTVTGEDTYGCINKSLFTLAVYPIPNILLSASPPVICEGNTLSIFASGASVSYSLNGMALTPPFIVGPAVTSNYYVNGISSNGCFGASAITVTVNALPSLTLSSSQPTICSGETATLTASGAVTYSWDFVPGTQEYTVFPTGTADYLVIGTGANGCTSSLTVTQYVDECTGIEERRKREPFFELYPNPGKGLYTVKSSGAGRLEVFDPLGQLIYIEEIQAEHHQLDLQQFSHGIYLVRLTTKETGRSIRLIKE